jgi:hypothetical protein
MEMLQNPSPCSVPTEPSQNLFLLTKRRNSGEKHREIPACLTHSACGPKSGLQSSKRNVAVLGRQINVFATTQSSDTFPLCQRTQRTEIRSTYLMPQDKNGVRLSNQPAYILSESDTCHMGTRKAKFRGNEWN